MSKSGADEWIENFRNSNIKEVSDLYIPYKQFLNEINESRKEAISAIHDIFHDRAQSCYGILISLGVVTAISLVLADRILPLILSVCVIICAIVYGVNVIIRNRRTEKINKMAHKLLYNELNNLIAAFYQLKYEDKDTKDFNEFAEIHKFELDALVHKCKCEMDKAYKEEI